MGAHGINAFDEDHAADWLADLCDQEDPKDFFRECLDLDGIEYLEMMESAGVIGTCVMIDGILHGPAPDLPEDAVDWITEHKMLAVKRFLPKAIAGLDAILGDDCELHDLWKEDKELYPKWKKMVSDLRTRLVAARG